MIYVSFSRSVNTHMVLAEKLQQKGNHPVPKIIQNAAPSLSSMKRRTGTVVGVKIASFSTQSTVPPRSLKSAAILKNAL
jgi:hypothetical protein